MDQKLFFKNHF
ncbi:hypothetical protein DSL72_001525 [Monilinia vaccinii-corymbosi]|uniref:Uncharacterized protein n=1 Tax=Monilinia vaccinii-corymbosi TaxID=61207 RepID=A0A8A3P7I7_9HELO|nr:hypothetical protein DSL72_001525 [Monilinia vaccinii-corymbosi]